MNSDRKGNDLFKYCKGQCGYGPNCSECKREARERRKDFQGRLEEKIVSENELCLSSGDSGDDSNVSNKQ